MMEPDTSDGVVTSAHGNDDDRYLIFRIGTQSFAAPLLTIREIVAPLVYRHVPNLHDYFLGLANLRGQIIGILDLGRRFELATGPNPEPIFLVFDIEGSTMAGIVNQVESVMTIPKDQIVHECRIAMKVPPLALQGFANTADKLLPIVHLPLLVSSEFKEFQIEQVS